MKTIEKKQKLIQPGKADGLSFWLFNVGNTICTFAIIGTVMLCFSNANPVATFNISVYAIFQTLFAFMLNILFHKAAKDKEVYIDE